MAKIYTTRRNIWSGYPEYKWKSSEFIYAYPSKGFFILAPYDQWKSYSLNGNCTSVSPPLSWKWTILVFCPCQLLRPLLRKGVSSQSADHWQKERSWMQWFGPSWSSWQRSISIQNICPFVVYNWRCGSCFTSLGVNPLPQRCSHCLEMYTTICPETNLVLHWF